MKTRTTLALAGALLLASNAQAGPQDASKPMDHGKMKMDHAAMQMPMTPEARATMANTMFDKIDTNKDGSLSRAEFVEHHRTMSMGHGAMGMDHGKMQMPGMSMGKSHAHGSDFVALDKNKDGKLSKAEFPAGHPLLPHFGMSDANGDGMLSKDEFAAGLKMIAK